MSRLKLRTEREKRAWSRAELARRAGMHPVTVGQIEAGRLAPYPVQLSKLAAALGVPEVDAARLLEEEDGDNASA